MKNNKKGNQGLPNGLPAKITELIKSESDRGVILILGAYLEELCGDVIRAACVTDDEADNILELRQPAGDFASKISLGVAFGLIHESEAKALHIIRKIRNSAAHFDKTGNGFDVLFDADKTIDHVTNLTSVMRIEKPNRTKESIRDKFVICARLLALQIIYRSTQAEKSNPPPTFKEVMRTERAKLEGLPEGERLAEIEGFLKENKFETQTERMRALMEFVRNKIKERDENTDKQ